MPRGWFDYFGNALPENPTEEDIAKREFNLRIMADKKPYFMGYIYPKVMKDYKAFMKEVKFKCGFVYRAGIEDLLQLPEDKCTDEQQAFVHYYQNRMPVGNNNCVMNRICRKIEAEFGSKTKFDGITEPFDYSILMSDAGYSKYYFYIIKKLFEEHKQRMQDFMKQEKVRNVRTSMSETDARMARENFVREFKEAAYSQCSNAEELCNIVVELCYRKEGTKQFAWDVCGDKILQNLLKKSGGFLSYPILDPDGDFEYGGWTFSMIRKESDVWAKLL